MDEQQLQQQIVQLVQAALQGDQQANQQIEQIMLAAQQGNPQAVQIALMIQMVAQQLQQGAPQPGPDQMMAAKFGAKLDYIRQLKGQCPEGYEMQYYKKGGQLCKRCMKTHQDGGDMQEAPRSIKEQFQYAKCGGKTKKKACGGAVESEKCGGKPKLKKKAYGGFIDKAACGKKINKHFLGGKQRSPFTGFEGFSYEYSAPRPSNLGRADRPEFEVIRNNGKYVMDRDRYYDPDLYEETGKLQPVEDWSYSSGPNGDSYATPTEINSFNSLKRHALMNQLLGGNFTKKISLDKCGSKLKKKIISKGEDGLKTPFKSTIGYANTRGDSYSSHKIYPTEDDYNEGRYYERRYYRNDFGDDNYYQDYNPNNLAVDYNTLDYSNVESSPGGRNSGNEYGYYNGASSVLVGPSEYLKYLMSGDEKYLLYNPETVTSRGAKSAFGIKSDVRFKGL